MNAIGEVVLWVCMVVGPGGCVYMVVGSWWQRGRR